MSFTHREMLSFDRLCDAIQYGERAPKLTDKPPPEAPISDGVSLMRATLSDGRILWRAKIYDMASMKKRVRTYLHNPGVAA